MSCDSNDDELKLTKEYKSLLSYIRPLIDQLDKSKDAQLCLLWLSKLEQCAVSDRKFRNVILAELCKQVKANSLKPPFNAAPPNKSLRVLCCSDWKVSSWNTGNDYGDNSTEDALTTSSQRSQSNQPKRQTSPNYPRTDGCRVNSSKNKCLMKGGKDSGAHNECFAIQKAYHDRAQSDQLVIEKYQEIIKSLVAQQLKTDGSPNKLKKLQTSYETKLAEVLHICKRSQEENSVLRQKVETLNKGNARIPKLKAENESLKKHVFQLEETNNSIKAKVKGLEEKLRSVPALVEKLNEAEKKLKETEKRLANVETKHKENFRNWEMGHQSKMKEQEQKYNEELSKFEKLLNEKQVEVDNLKEQIKDQQSRFEEEIIKLKQEFLENSAGERDKKKIKSLKNKTKNLEKHREHMMMLFQSQLQQILAKKDFYISTLEMILKMNTAESGSTTMNSDVQNILHRKVADLESQYRKLLEDSEQQFLRQRQLDLQKIHSLEKQLLQSGGVIEDDDINVNQLKTFSPVCLVEAKNEIGHDIIF